MDAQSIIKKLHALANPENVKGMARFGISSKNTLGLSMPVIRVLAKEIGKNHELALVLWDSKIHEAKILAGLIDIPKKVTEKQAEEWVKDFDSWDVCDQVCMNLFDKTDFAFPKAIEWTQRKEEFVKRAGFAMFASLAVHAKKADDKIFEEFLVCVFNEAEDERNFVKKALNWALRQIGKRNLYLNKKAIECCEDILKNYSNSKSARWIATDALRELQSEKVKERLEKKNV